MRNQGHLFFMKAHKGDNTKRHKESGHHPEHPGNKQKDSCNDPQNSNRSALGNFGSIEHEHRTREQGYDHRHERKGKGSHLCNASDDKSNSGINQ